MAEGTQLRGGRMRVPRSRGAMSGLLLVLLGVWGGLVPFIGHYFDFAYTPVATWTWTAARGWLEVLPGGAAVLGGLLMIASTNRMSAMLGSWLGIAAGAWFVVGPQLATFIHIGSTGTPTATSQGMRALESLAYFYALGAAMLFVAATALGRLSIHSVRDATAAARRDEAMREASMRQQTADQQRVPTATTSDGATTSRMPAAPPYTDREMAHGTNDHSHRHFFRRHREDEPVASDGTPLRVSDVRNRVEDERAER